MDKSEFDQYADEYRKLHAAAISASGETPEYFAQYKIADLVTHARNRAVSVSRILDFGCGVGTSTPYFLEAFPDAELVGVDVSSRSLELARSRYAGKATYSLMQEKIAYPDNSFDLVFAACVFHHIPFGEHRHWLSEVLRVLKPGGFIAVFEHNPLNPLTVHSVNTCEFDENAVLMRASYLRSILGELQYRDIRHHYRIFFPRKLSVFRPLEKYMTWLPFGAQYSVTAQKS